MNIPLNEIRQAIGSAADWQKHLTDPFSAESFADPHKPFFVIGDLTFPEQVCIDDDAEHLFIFESLIKIAGESKLWPRNCKSDICRETNFEAAGGKNYEIDSYCKNPDLTRPLHKEFARVAKALLGPEIYTESSLELTHERSAVIAGSGQLDTDWHIDARADTIAMGLVSDVLPTQILLNPTAESDYGRLGRLVSVMGIPLEEANLKIVTLPANKLAVVPMGIPHRGQIAMETIPKRNFMRWWINYERPDKMTLI